jgi:hypothetical protein
MEHFAANTRDDTPTARQQPAWGTFMFGLDRSGTTLLTMMVGAHSNIAVPLSTTGMWYDVALGLPEDFDSTEGAARVVDQILQHERIRLWDQRLDRERLIADVQPGDFGSVVAAFHREYGRQSGKPVWASMDISTLDNMHLVNAWFPDARFVHIVRDGRDVALSHQGYKYGAGNIAEVAVKWEARVTRNLRMGAMLPADRYYTLRYEDLVLSPEPTLRQLCKFIGVPFSSEMLDYQKSVDRKIPKDKMFLWPALNGPPKAEKVGRWKKEMTVAQRVLFEQRAGSLLRELGYETFSIPPRSVAAMLLETWYCIGQGGRFKRLRQILPANKG